jgi:hypothetical protein
MEGKELLKTVDQVRGYLLNSSVPDFIAEKMVAVLDAAEEKAQQDINYFSGF